MAKDKDKEFDKEYAELKLSYALDNDEIRQLFEDWLRKHEKYYQLIEKRPAVHKHYPYTPAITRAVNIAKRALDVLLIRLNKLGLSYDSAADIYYDYCRINRKERGHLGINYVIPRVVVKGKIWGFQCRTKKDFSRLAKILKSGRLKENEEWFMEKYETFRFFPKQLESNADIEAIGFYSKELAYVFNERMKKSYYLLEKDKCFVEDNSLKDGRYLTLKIDLSKRIEDIEKETKGIIKFFKNIVDNLNPPVRETGARKQNIKLYKRYLEVYKLVEKKGGKWTEIAKEVFPEDFMSKDEQLESDSDYIPNPESAIAKVHNYYREARTLIAEGLP